MLILALDAALGRCSAVLWRDGAVVAERMAVAARGQPAVLPPLVRAVLAAAPGAAFDAVAVCTGPGSFTGLRAAIALAHGLALGAGVPVLGVPVAAALRAQLGDAGGRAPWVAIDSRRGRVFLDRGERAEAVALAALPAAAGPVALLGDAAVAVAARLAARGDDVWLSDARLPRAGDVAAVAARQLQGAAPLVPAQPLYVDPPDAKLPAGGLRPAPAPPPCPPPCPPP